jgi:hypothetical protein
VPVVPQRADLRSGAVAQRKIKRRRTEAKKKVAIGVQKIVRGWSWGIRAKKILPSKPQMARITSTSSSASTAMAGGDSTYTHSHSPPPQHRQGTGQPAPEPQGCVQPNGQSHEGRSGRRRAPSPSQARQAQRQGAHSQPAHGSAGGYGLVRRTTGSQCCTQPLQYQYQAPRSSRCNFRLRGAPCGAARARR